MKYVSLLQPWLSNLSIFNIDIDLIIKSIINNNIDYTKPIIFY